MNSVSISGTLFLKHCYCSETATVAAYSYTKQPATFNDKRIMYVAATMAQFISWLCVLEYGLLSWAIIETIFVANSCDSGNIRIDPIFLFIVIAVIDALLSYILSISSYMYPVKLLVMMSKCNTDGNDSGSNTIYAYHDTRTSSYFYTNDNNDTISEFTRSCHQVYYAWEQC